MAGGDIAGGEGVIGREVPAGAHPYLTGSRVGPVALVADPVGSGAGRSGRYTERVEDLGVRHVGRGRVEEMGDVAVGVATRGEIGGAVLYTEKSAALTAVNVGPIADRVAFASRVGESVGGGGFGALVDTVKTVVREAGGPSGDHSAKTIEGVIRCDRVLG